jgi:hypothetical protein
MVEEEKKEEAEAPVNRTSFETFLETTQSLY